MKKQIPFKREFECWLVDEGGLKSTSANSYSSYVYSALKEQEIPFELVFRLVDNNDQTQRIRLFINLLNNVLEYYHKESIEINDKTLSNWKTGLARYIEFICDWLEVLDTDYWAGDVRLFTADAHATRFNSFLANGKITLVYTRQELIDIFIFRVTTQDRCYEDICFPIGLIKRILYKDKQARKDFDRMLRDLINKIQIHTKSGVFLLENIDKLKIDVCAKKVTVLVGSKEHVVLTPTHTGSFVDMCVSQLRDITIDHIKSMHEIMYGLIDELTEIQKLCKAISLELSESQRLRNSTMKDTYSPLIENNISKTVNTDQLLKEVKKLFDDMDLQLMDRSENIKKGKSRVGLVNG